MGQKEYHYAGRMTIRIRDAKSSDHPDYLRLFPELRVDDPLPDMAKWEREIRPTTFIAERDGAVVGLLFYVLMKEIGFVKNIISDPALRRQGIGRALMTEAFARFRAAGCRTCVLNVFPDNEAAIALYESFGLSRVHTSHAVKVKWDLVASRAPSTSTLRTRTIEPADDARVEPAMKLMSGQLAEARGRGRVLLVLENEDGSIEGATVLDPSFPGAYPFRMAKPDHAWTFLHSLLPYRKAEHDMLNVVIEGDRNLAMALLDAGATLRLESMHMRGPIPT
jgi:ribosomal protein S18 acetylase RimI-like enzyme